MASNRAICRLLDSDVFFFNAAICSQNCICFVRAVVKQVAALDVYGKLPPEADINAMVKQLRDAIYALNLDVRLYVPLNISFFCQ